MDFFDLNLRDEPFVDYQDYTNHLFACVNLPLSAYIQRLMPLFAEDSGGFKNVLYPDIEVARDLCAQQLIDFHPAVPALNDSSNDEKAEEVSDELEALFADIMEVEPEKEPTLGPKELLAYINARAALAEVFLPLYKLCRNFAPYTCFCFACGILFSTQTRCASIFQVVNQNGSLSAPSIESAARVFFGEQFTIIQTYGQMSLALVELQPVLSLQVNGAMPFSTLISPDKRIIDFLFGTHPMQIDENYIRFFSRLPETEDPFFANGQILNDLRISFHDGVRLFSLFEGEGSGREFTIQHFCQEQNISCIPINCSKLFVYDFRFVEQALWAAARECLLTGACICMDSLTYKEPEKNKFFCCMDLAFGKFLRRDLTVFAVSKEKLPM